MPENMIKIKTLNCVCSCCPSQWKGVTENNETIYINYRYGQLKIQLSEVDGTLRDALNSVPVYLDQIGDEWDSKMNTEKLMEILRLDGMQTKNKRIYCNLVLC